MYQKKHKPKKCNNSGSQKNSNVRLLGFVLLAVGLVTILSFLLPPKICVLFLSVMLLVCGLLLLRSDT